MQTTFTCYNDPGHGWLKVSKTQLAELEIAHRISGYSYENGDDAFLEEDCDAMVLITALRERGIEPKLVDKYSNKSSRIRNYNSYKHLSADEQKRLANLRQRMLDSKNWSLKVEKQINKADLNALEYWQTLYKF